MSSKDGMKEYKKGIECLKTSCIKCRFQPDFTSAIPYLKTAADEFHSCNNFEKEIEARHHLITCFQKEESFWEEGKENEKLSNLYLTKLKSPSESYNSIESAYNAYIRHHSYEDSIKCLMKASDNFLEQENDKEAEKCLDLAFDGIKKNYHVMTMDENASQMYIYDCIDKYINLAFQKEKFKKGAIISNRGAELIKKEKSDEINLIDKYYGIQAIAEIVDKEKDKEDKYKDTIKKGTKLINNESGLCYKVNSLMNKIKQYNNEEDKEIMDMVYEISAKVPNNVYKKLYKYVEDNKINDIKNEKDKITGYDDESSDLR